MNYYSGSRNLIPTYYAECKFPNDITLNWVDPNLSINFIYWDLREEIRAYSKKVENHHNILQNEANENHRGCSTKTYLCCDF